MIVEFLGGLWHREVESLSAVELDLDESRRQDASTEIDDVVRADLVFVKGLLALEDLAGGRVDPDVVLDELAAARDAAVGELDHARKRGWDEGRHGWELLLRSRGRGKERRGEVRLDGRERRHQNKGKS
jgi:hypothetical protein